MNDLINRQDAIDCCRNEWEEEVEERLRLLPSAERKRGEWIYDGLTFENDSLYKCSICCHRVPMEYGEMKFYSYCPNCGAEMRGDDD